MAEAIGKLGDPLAGPHLLRLFADTKQPTAVRDTVAYAIARIGYEPALSALLAALSDPEPTVRLCSVAAIAKLMPPVVRGVLHDLLNVEPNVRVREALAAALQTIPAVPAPTFRVISNTTTPAELVAGHAKGKRPTLPQEPKTAAPVNASEGLRGLPDHLTQRLPGKAVTTINAKHPKLLVA